MQKGLANPNEGYRACRIIILVAFFCMSIPLVEVFESSQLCFVFVQELALANSSEGYRACRIIILVALCCMNSPKVQVFESSQLLFILVQELA